MQTAPTDLQWLLPILMFALFSFSAEYTKIRPPRKKGFTVCNKQEKIVYKVLKPPMWDLCQIRKSENKGGRVFLHLIAKKTWIISDPKLYQNKDEKCIFTMEKNLNSQHYSTGHVWKTCTKLFEWIYINTNIYNQWDIITFLPWLYLLKGHNKLPRFFIWICF